jgi:two-component system, sensor histidine kinase and response regulator
VLLNLLDNAGRYAPSKSTLSVEVSEARDGERLEIRVKNPGPQIPHELRSRIFSKYVRLKSGGHDTSSGRGLGLVFCRIAVEAHGGTIEVEDHASETVFLVRLPRRAGEP